METRKHLLSDEERDWELHLKTTKEVKEVEGIEEVINFIVFESGKGSKTTPQEAH